MPIFYAADGNLVVLSSSFGEFEDFLLLRVCSLDQQALGNRLAHIPSSNCIANLHPGNVLKSNNILTIHHMYYLSVYLHILSAVFWIGGMLFTIAVLVPASRDRLLVEKRGAFFKLIGEKFSRISWILFLVLIITGITNLTSRGIPVNSLLDSAFWQGPFGSRLFIKLHLFAAVLVLSGVHDFYAGPRAARLMDKDESASKTHLFRKITSWIGRINFVLGLVILYYAIRLTRG